MEHKLWVQVSALLLLLLLLGPSALADNESSTPIPAAPETPAAPTLALTPGPKPAKPEPEPEPEPKPEPKPEPEPDNNSETDLSSGVNDNATSSDGTSLTNSTKIVDEKGTISEEATSLPAQEKNSTSATVPPQTTASTTLSTTSKTEPLPAPTSPAHVETSHNESQSEAPVHRVTLTTAMTQTPSSRTTSPTTTTSTTTTVASTPSTTTASTTTSTTITTTAAAARESTQAPAPREKTTQGQSDGVSHKAITPSQLNVGQETTVVQEGPTLDPLLAGLVSAFVIAAVIITLLLFLKLRRRDSRPEFRRLQDLPMDDMMEDTPLSMYNY